MPLLRLYKLPQTVRNIGRMREILTVVARHGFGSLFARTGIMGGWARLRARLRADDVEVVSYSIEERIRMILEELGPTFVKFGQILATRPDLVPMSLILELRRLQDNVPAFPFELAIAQVRQELGRPPEQVFETFDHRPLAAASIGQVHRAVLHSGEQVVVKIRRPGIARVIRNDLEILHLLAGMVEDRVPESRKWSPRTMVDEFARSLSKEIDFSREAHNMARFAANFEHREHLKVPRVFPELSTERIMVMEYVDGVKVTDAAGLERLGTDRELVAARGTEAILKMIFEDGLFHADPHPGNFFILPDDRVCLLDYGMVGVLDEDRIDELLAFLLAILFGNADKIVELFRTMGIVDEFQDVRGLKLELKDLISRYYEREVGAIDIGKFVGELFEVVNRFGLTIPTDLFLMSKAIATLEGTVQEVLPDYNPIVAMRPYLLRIFTRRMSDPRYLAKPVRRTLEAYRSLARRLPGDLSALLARARRGDVGLEVRAPALEQARAESARAVNRVATAVMATAGLAVSSFLMVYGKDTWFMGFDLSTWVGFPLFALSLAVGGLAILRSAR